MLWCVCGLCFNSSPDLPYPTLTAPRQFYLVFALASMYIAMLMTGWGSQAGEAKVRPYVASRLG